MEYISTPLCAVDRCKTVETVTSINPVACNTLKISIDQKYIDELTKEYSPTQIDT
jgi:hypothetical protein